MESMIGQTLGQYQLVEQIGKGGMATVYKAFQPSLNRYVAVKILPAYFAHEAGFAERFTREAQAIAQLDHPNILPVYDFGKQDNISYIVMKYVSAGTLSDKLGRALSPAEAFEIIEQIARALDAAHEQGILHRDVKPGNILIDDRGWIYLSDFGLAKMVEGSVQLTGTGVGVGTPSYMSPEQGKGLKVDARTDVYALGIILFEMLTGQVPYEAETPMAVVIKHVTDPIPLPRRMNPNIPESVEKVLLKALAKDRDDRFISAGRMAAALKEAVQKLEPGIATMPIPSAPDATIDRRVDLPPSPPTTPPQVVGRPVPPSSPPPSISSPVATPDKPKKNWLPIVAGIGVLAIVGVCILAGLFYFMREDKNLTPTSTSAAGALTVVTDTPSPIGTPISPSPSPSPTTTPSSPADTPAPVCTPPACSNDEVYYCAGDCPGGCGTQCATTTPVSAADTIISSSSPSPSPTNTPVPADTPTSTFTPTPPPTFTPTTAAPRWADTGLRPVGRYADIWNTLNAGNGELGFPLANPVGDRLCARENFERGYMVWFDSPQEPQPVWAAVMPNRSENSGRKSYIFTDKWPGSPEYWCSEAEARAPLGPKRGFGMLWCIYPNLRSDIGYALDEEVGGPDYPRCTAQLFQGGAILHNPIDPQYWVFIDNGGWYRFDE